MPSTTSLGDDEYVVIESDRNGSGVGDTIFKTGGVERARIKADGTGTGWPNVIGGSVSVNAFNVIDYGAKGDCQELSDGAITSGQAALTSATAPFAASDVGKKVVVTAAGAAAADLVTTISAYVSPTQVTLAATAGATVTGALFYWGTDDTVGIQAAITAAMVTGAEVIFQHTFNALGIVCDYLVSNLTIDYSGFTAEPAGGYPYGFRAPRLRGSGRRSSRIRQLSGSTGPIILAQGKVGAGVGTSHNNKISGLTIEELTLNGTSGSTNHGIQLRSYVDCEVRNVHILNVGGSGVKLLRETFTVSDDEYSYNLVLDAVKVIAAARYGFECSGTNAIGATFRDTDATACTLGGYYLCPADMALVGARSIACGGPGFQTVRCSNTNSTNLSITFVGCHEEGSNNIAGNYAVQIDGVLSFQWIGGTLLEGASAAHLFGIGTANAGNPVSSSIIGGEFSGRSAQAGQMFVVTGSDSVGLVVDNPQVKLTSFNGTPPDVFHLLTDGGTNTSIRLPQYSGTGIPSGVGDIESAVESIPWWAASSAVSVALAGGTIRMVFIRPKTTVTISKLTSMSGTTTITSGATLAKMGIYALNAAKTSLTLVAQTASDTTLWQTAATKYQRALSTTGGFPASYTLQAGLWYAFALIQVGGTSGNIAGVNGGAGVGLSELVAVRLFAGQTDLASPITVPGTTSQSAGVPYIFAS